ncbi:Co(2+)/Mg(2+) efflux protein ApaG [Coraliomargarita parva]|uniref:Co(2+)/Mg(2+) efflux protein ApaG n=1 Tax=Coraliomargarita parva TaxID=3014050 RepID=UPI0022B3940C|nr:ApaG domain [Coraliomargarita parva]
MSDESKTLPGLRASLDKLVYFHDAQKRGSEMEHVFIYFITISNLSDQRVTLLGRRWVLNEATGHRKVIEGDGIVGKEPTLSPGEVFSYNSYHMTHCNCTAQGAFHGLDESGAHIHVPIPAFEMHIPEADGGHSTT